MYIHHALLLVDPPIISIMCRVVTVLFIFMQVKFSLGYSKSFFNIVYNISSNCACACACLDRVLSPDLEWLPVGLAVERSLLMLLLESKPSLVVGTCDTVEGLAICPGRASESSQPSTHAQICSYLYCVMASHTNADVTRFVVCNYYVASHKNVACTRETLHVRFAVRIAGNEHGINP